MASRFKKSDHIFFLFGVDDYTIQDSQLKPRYYLTKERAEKYNAGAAEIVEYIPIIYGRWLDEDFPENPVTVHGMAICSICGEFSHKAEHGYNILSDYCPHCGARMTFSGMEGT